MGNSESFVPTLFGENISKYRKKLNLTQAELAEKIGVTQKHLSEIESGLKFPSATLIEQLSISLDKPVAAFFGGTVHNAYDFSNSVVGLLMANIQPKLDLIFNRLDSLDKKISNMKITIQMDNPEQ